MDADTVEGGSMEIEDNARAHENRVQRQAAKVNSDDFQQNVEDAAKNPDGKEAIALVKRRLRASAWPARSRAAPRRSRKPA